MEINADSIKNLLDKAGILYSIHNEQHGKRFAVIDGNNKVPDLLHISVYNSGTVILSGVLSKMTLRQFIEKLK